MLEAIKYAFASSHHQLPTGLSPRHHAGAAAVRTVRPRQREHVPLFDHGPAAPAAPVPVRQPPLQPHQDHDPQPHGRLPRHAADGLAQGRPRDHDSLPDPPLRRLLHAARRSSLLRSCSHSLPLTGPRRRLHTRDEPHAASLHLHVLLRQDARPRAVARAPHPPPRRRPLHPRHAPPDHHPPHQQHPGRRVHHPNLQARTPPPSLRHPHLPPHECLRYAYSHLLHARTRHLLLPASRLHQQQHDCPCPLLTHP